MQIEGDTLIVNEAVSDEMCEEFIALFMQTEIKTVHIRTEQISSSVLQALFCAKEKKKIVCDDSFLTKVFEHVR